MPFSASQPMRTSDSPSLTVAMNVATGVMKDSKSYVIIGAVLK